MTKDAVKPSAPAVAQIEPRNITISEFSKYQSNEMTKFAASLRTYKKSLLYLGGTLALALIFAYKGNQIAHQQLFGLDNRGGSYLTLTTPHDEDHYAYNREFQRMHVLGESKIGDLSIHSTALIRDLGGQLPTPGNHQIPKRAPHEKFY